MRIWLFLFLWIPVCACIAQHRELHKRVTHLKNDAESLHLHVQYKLTIQGREDTTYSESMIVEYKKAGQGVEVKNGNYQTTRVKNGVYAIANHIDKTLQVGLDSTVGLNALQMMGQLSLIVDSTTQYTQSEKSGLQKFKMLYKDFDYSSIEMVFEKGSGKLKSIYAVFADDYPEPYKYIKVEYLIWDNKWKAPVGFPYLEQFVTKVGSRYELSSTMSGYKLFQMERGRL